MEPAGRKKHFLRCVTYNACQPFGLIINYSVTTVILPRVGVSKPQITSSKVVLPDPDAPTIGFSDQRELINLYFSELSVFRRKKTPQLVLYFQQIHLLEGV